MILELGLYLTCCFYFTHGYDFTHRIKLQEWRDTKGISYKRPPMPVRPQSRRTLALPQPYWATMEEDEAHSLISAVDRSLDDCIKLLTEVR